MIRVCSSRVACRCRPLHHEPATKAYVWQPITFSTSQNELLVEPSRRCRQWWYGRTSFGDDIVMPVSKERGGDGIREALQHSAEQAGDSALLITGYSWPISNTLGKCCVLAAQHRRSDAVKRASAELGANLALSSIRFKSNGGPWSTCHLFQHVLSANANDAKAWRRTASLHRASKSYASRERSPPCVEGRTGCRQRERAAHKNCVRPGTQATERTALSDALRTYCTVQKQVSEGMNIGPRRRRSQTTASQGTRHDLVGKRLTRRGSTARPNRHQWVAASTTRSRVRTAKRAPAYRP